MLTAGYFSLAFFRLWISFIFPGVEALNADEVQSAVKSALAEDIGSGDVTTLATIPEQAVAGAMMRARETLVVAGLAFAEAAFRHLAPEIKIARSVEDGQRVAG